MEKSPEAFRTISEVAGDLDLPQHVLRFWETRFSTIRPLKRGGGRRYYRPDDVELLKGIRHLLYGQGYTIKGVQRIIKQDGLRFVQAIGRGEQAVAPGPRPEGQDVEDDRALSREPSDRDAAPEPGRDQLEAAEASEAALGPLRALAGLSPEAVDRLQSALDELLECRRILGTLKSD